jgi:hypothetical protein
MTEATALKAKAGRVLAPGSSPLGRTIPQNLFPARRIVPAVRDYDKERGALRLRVASPPRRKCLADAAPHGGERGGRNRDVYEHAVCRPSVAWAAMNARTQISVRSHPLVGGVPPRCVAICRFVRHTSDARSCYARGCRPVEHRWHTMMLGESRCAPRVLPVNPCYAESV